MRIYELLNTHPPACRYGERSNGIRIQQKPCPLDAPSPLGRAGVGFHGGFLGVPFYRVTPIKGQSQGLLEQRLRPEPEAAEVAGHEDVTTVEVQAMCAATAPYGNT